MTAFSSWQSFFSRARVALTFGASILGAMTLSCALTSKANPMSPRFFTPTGVLESEAPVRELSSVHELRLGQVDSAAHLEERIAYRVSDTEHAELVAVIVDHNASPMLRSRAMARIGSRIAMMSVANSSSR